MNKAGTLRRQLHTAHSRFTFSFQGIKIDFFSDEDDSPAHIGYCNILPVHLDKDCGKIVFTINGLHTFPAGQVTGE